MGIRLLLATNNPNKAREIREILRELPVEVFTPAETGIPFEVVEDGETFLENARKKAREASRLWDGFVLAEDSGLEVDALGGAPGVHSARFAGEEATDEANIRKLLKAMESVPDEKRSARFRCVMVLVDSRGSEKVFEGTVEGRIIHEMKGKEGFGYDPVFMIEGYGKTFAELGPDVKNRISHRAEALRKVRLALQEILEGRSSPY
jgi:XTP/dITP diphosphohydrolase